MISPLNCRTPGAPTSGSSFRLGFLGSYVFIQKFFGGRDLGSLRCSFCSDAALLNIYHVIEVNSAKWPKVNAQGAKAFSDFMVSKETQDMIKTFGVDKFGSPLFFPDAGKKVEDLGK